MKKRVVPRVRLSDGSPRQFMERPDAAPKSTEITVTRARARLNHAVRRGEIERPAVCPQCRETPGVNATGQSKMWALFKLGFDHWQTVEWKCIECYRAKEPA